MSMTREEFLAKHFPEVEPGQRPCGNKVLVQLMLVQKKHGSIILASDTQDFNKNSTIVCRVVKKGEIAFRSRDTGMLWKEGAWANIGDIVLMPRYGGTNRIEVPLNEDETVIFATYDDYSITNVVEGRFELYSEQIL